MNQKQLQVGFQIEQVDNGYILMVSTNFREGYPQRRFVFNTLLQMQNFITNYLEEA